MPTSAVSTQKQAPLLGHGLAQPAVEQVQTPLLQTPDGQTLPQAPQLLGSVFRFTQAPLQQTVPLGQHDPLQQLPDEQELPHVPQLFGSRFRFTQVLLQQTSPTAQHSELQHRPDRQVRPQMPQLLGSLLMLTHFP